MKKAKKPEEIKPQKAKFASADAILDTMGDALLVLDVQRRVIEANKATAKLWGYAQEEMVNLTFKQMFPKKEHEKHYAEMKGAVETGTIRSFETIALTKDGKEIPVMLSGGTAMKDAEGKPVGFIGVFRDITELKRAQEKEREFTATIAAEKAEREAMEESRALLEERAKKLTDSRTAMIHMLKSLDKTGKELTAARDYTDNVIKSMIDTLMVVDPDGRIKTVNKATSDLLGYKEKELIGKPAATIFAEEEEEEEEEVSIFKGTRLKKLIEEGTIRDYDMKYRTKKGEVIPVSFSGAVMRETRSTTDIDTDKRGKIVGIVGIAKDMRERKKMEKQRIKAERLAATREARTQTLEKTKKTLEKRVRERTKMLERAKVEAETLFTELDEAYKELRRTQNELVRREKLIAAGGLAAGVAHEIRNPLSIIGMSVQYLHSKFEEDDSRREFTEAIIDKVEKLDRVTKELINYARPRELNLRKRDVRKILDRTLRLAKHKCDAQKVKIVKRSPKSMPRVRIDDDLIEQVFLNLISNALWAMPEGGNLTISTRIITDKSTDKHGSAPIRKKSVEIRVKDTGCGIPKKEINRIFDPFFTARTDGSGLGLSIVHRIIEDHKGSIDVESKIDNGTIFTIRLPISPPPEKIVKIKRENKWQVKKY